MSHPWMPNSAEKTRNKMMERIGIKEIDELFNDIPPTIRLQRDYWDKLPIGKGRILSEIEVKRIAEEILSKNKVFINPAPFLGCGAWPHYVPAPVRYIISRGEFLTAYTPYQAEINQGLMQALFEYQSMMAELLDMDIVNSSMYDWGSAAAEALLMSLRVKRRRRKIVLCGTLNPFHEKVIRTYLEPHNITIVKTGIDRERGICTAEELSKVVDNDTAAVYIENPNFFGIIEEEIQEIADITHKAGALYVIGVEPLSLGLIKPPGQLGADIAVGEGQPLGLGLNYGGPYLGIFAIKYDMKLLRQMPGRLIGLTTTIDGGDRAFAMILQTREQHIRREKATSNICTNEALSAIAAAVYLALLGKHGIRELAELIYYNSHYAAKRLGEVTRVNTEVFSSDFFKEFPVKIEAAGKKYADLHEYLLKNNVHGGYYIGDIYPWLGETAIFSFTELHTKEDIDRLVDLFKKFMEG